MLALEFPPINEVIRWQDVFPTFNKVALIACLASLIGITIYLLAARRDPLVAPTGVRNVAETGVEFIEDQIVMQTIGRDGLGWTPFLLTIFIFVYLCNLPGIIPILHMPATARMAIPLFLAVVVWLTYNVVGFKHNGIKLPHRHALAAQRAGRDAPARRPHRVPLEHHPAPVQPGGPTLRQHARRAHAARHVRPADERHAVRRDEAAGCSSRWPSCRSSCCCS